MKMAVASSIAGPRSVVNRKATLIHGGSHERRKTRLVDWNLTLLKRFDLVRILVHTDDVHAESLPDMLR